MSLAEPTEVVVATCDPCNVRWTVLSGELTGCPDCGQRFKVTRRATVQTIKGESS